MVIEGYNDVGFNIGDRVIVIASVAELERISLNGKQRGRTYYITMIEEDKNRYYLEREDDYYVGSKECCCWVKREMIEIKH